MRKLLFTVIFLLSVCIPAYPEGKYIEVQASGRGNSRAEAMSDAWNEALRKNMGTLIMSREEINNDILTDKVVQVSRGSVKDSRIISENTRNGEVMLTVIFRIDTEALRDDVRKFREGKGGDIVVKRTPSLERGIKAIGAFFREVELLDFIDAEIEDRKIDIAKGEFSVLVRIIFNREKYYRQFSSALSSILDDAVLKSDVFTELADEDQSEKYHSTIYILGENRTFRGWTLPRKFFEAMKSAPCLEALGRRELLRTQKRIWVNIALLNSSGREISRRRIPVALPVTNILFFSPLQGNAASPWGIAGGNFGQPVLICAPFFGIVSKNGAFYESLFSDRSDPLEQRFVFHLPEETLSGISSSLSWLNLEE